MNRTEIKRQLTSLINNTQDVIETLKSKQGWFQEIKDKLDDLDKHLEKEGRLDFYVQEVMGFISDAFFTNELENLQTQAEGLHASIHSYAEEMSESRAEKIYEQYEALDEVLGKLDPDYEDIESAIEGLREVIDLLNEMRS